MARTERRRTRKGSTARETAGREKEKERERGGREEKEREGRRRREREGMVGSGSCDCFGFDLGSIYRVHARMCPNPPTRHSVSNATDLSMNVHTEATSECA